MANAVALDAGNAIIKAKCATNEIEFPHMMIQLSPQEFRRATERVGTAHGDYFMINGVPYVIGERAERHGIFERQHGAARYVDTYYGVFLAATLARLYRKSMRRVFLVASHAPGDFDYREDLMAASVKRWEVWNEGNEYHFEIDDAATYDEPLGGLYNVMLSKDGTKFQRGELNKAVTLTIDIGGHTVDGLVVDPGGAVDYSTAKSVKTGILEVIETFLKDFKTNNKRRLQKVDRFPATEVRNAIRTGVFNLRGMGQVPCEDEANQACNMLVNQIVNIYDSYGGSANYDYVLLTGGGSALLENRLRNVIQHNAIILADRSEELHLANVRGGMKFFRLHEAVGSFQ